MSEKVSLMNQLFLIYYEASEKMSLSWVKLFFHVSNRVKTIFSQVKHFISCVKPSEKKNFFMCQAEWKSFFFFFFHMSNRVKMFLCSCVKPSEKGFYTGDLFFFFLCRAEWKKLERINLFHHLTRRACFRYKYLFEPWISRRCCSHDTFY